MKNVLVCIAYFYPHVGGYEKYIQELYTRINNNFNVDILVFDIQKNPEFEKLDGMNVYRLESYGLFGNMYPVPKFNIKNIKTLKKIFKTEYLFVNTHTRFFMSSFFGCIISKMKSTKLIHTEHGTGPVIFDNFIVNLISNIYDLSISKVIIKSANINIGISKASCNYLHDKGAKNLYLLQNGVDTISFRKNKSNLKKDLKIVESKKVITFIGRLIYAKGVQDLIKCFFNIKKLGIPAKLVIVGDGSFKTSLKNLANNDKDILFLGLRNDIVDILSITDVLVNPSYSEGLPTSILEAASVGVPVVATDVGGTKEIFIKEMGFLVNLNDKKSLLEYMIKVLKSDDSQLNQNIRRKHMQKNFDWDIIANKFLNILERNQIC